MQVHDAIDRIAPTLEPDQPVVMYQNWHHLLFLHWPVPPEELQKLLPAGLTVDTFEGNAYVGLIPLTVTGARPVLAPPRPGISAFHEVNVRTCVHHEGRDPGVWFFSLDASSAVAVATARAAYKLPYFHSQMEMSASDDPLPQVRFESHRDDQRGQTPAHVHARYAPANAVTRQAAPGTIEFFLIERYIFYFADDHHLNRVRVHHQPFSIQQAELSDLDETLVWAAGIRRSENAPLRHYVSEVNVKVYPAEKVR